MIASAATVAGILRARLRARIGSSYDVAAGARMLRARSRETFVVSGTLRDDGREAEVAWRAPDELRLDGALEGDPILVDRLARLAERGHQVCGTPTGPCFDLDLEQPHTVFLALLEAFVPGSTRMAGEVPILAPAGPDDADL